MKYKKYNRVLSQRAASYFHLTKTDTIMINGTKLSLNRICTTMTQQTCDKNFYECSTSTSYFLSPPTSHLYLYYHPPWWVATAEGPGECLTCHSWSWHSPAAKHLVHFAPKMLLLLWRVVLAHVRKIIIIICLYKVQSKSTTTSISYETNTMTIVEKTICYRLMEKIAKLTQIFNFPCGWSGPEASKNIYVFSAYVMK